MTEKKLACPFLVVMLIFSITIVSVDGDPPLPKLFVDPPIYTATQLGEVFTININITNVQDLAGFEFKLGYNTTLLDALNASVGPFPKPPISHIIMQINELEGYVWIAVLCGPTEGNGTLATVTFKVTYAESASCALNLYDTILLNSKAESIPHDVADGNYEFAVLSITVTTDKPTYNQGETVKIQGNLTLDGSPQQGLVAIEVDDPDNYGIVRRTLQIGPTPPPGEIIIIDVVPCDMWGEPKESFSRGTNAYFNVTIRNNSTKGKNVAVTANAYDGNMVPLGAPTDYTTIGPGISTFIMCIYIPSWACIGTGIAYASVFTDLPRNGGVPYCPEKSATFQITGSSSSSQSSGSSSTTENPETTGNYTLTFKLPVQNVKVGNYTVYATSSYLKQKTISTITFELILFGDVNGDGDIRSDDVFAVLAALTKKVKGIMTVPELLAENPRYDVNGDGDIRSDDVFAVLAALTKKVLGC